MSLIKATDRDILMENLNNRISFSNFKLSYEGMGGFTFTEYTTKWIQHSAFHFCFCNKINEIREERNTNSIYTGSVTSRACASTQATHLRFSTIFVKLILQTLNHTRTTHPLCSGILKTQETLGSLIKFAVIRREWACDWKYVWKC